MALTPEQQAKVDEIRASEEARGITSFTAGKEAASVTDFFRNVFGQDPNAEELQSLTALAQQAPSRADFYQQAGQQEFGSLDYEQQLIGGKQAAGGTQVLSDENKAGEKELASFSERSALGQGVTEAGQKVYSYFDSSRGVRVNAPAGQHFELLPGGGVRMVEGLIPREQVGQTTSSLFAQPTQGGAPTPGFTEEQLAITPAEGKEVARTGTSGKNPKTGVDVPVGPDEIFIEYTDGTFEVRKHSGIQQPGEAKPLGEAGPTAEELGITRQTEIKGGPGTEVTRAPQSAAQVLQTMIDEGADPQAIDEFLQSEGETSTADLQHVGKTYRGKTAKEGYSFYVDPKTRQILERPEVLAKVAQPLTVAGVAGTKIDVTSKFKSVFGRDPNAEELKYWLSRVDKQGSALIGAMQFFKANGGKDGKTPAIADPVEAMKAAANEGQAKAAQLFTDEGITTKSSEEKQRRAEAMLPDIVESESATEFTKEMLAETQFQEAQNDLNLAKDALRKLDAGHLINLQEAEHGERARGLTTAQVRRNQSEFDIAYQRERAMVALEVQAYSDIVQSQMAITGMMIDAFKFDQQAAQQDYQNRFNRATALYNMIRQDEQDEFNMQQKLQDNMRSNLSVVTGMLASGNLKYDQLSGDQRAQLAYMEQSVGLPAGFTSFVGQVTKDPEVTIGASITGADGTVMTPVYTVNPTTGEIKTTHITQPIKERVPSSGGSGKPTEGSIARTAQQDMAAQLNQRRGGDGYISPEDYKQARSAWISAGYSGATFNDSFQYYANPANPQDYRLPIPE